MLFHTFNSQDERREFGGSAFIEIQYCKLPADTKLKKIVASKSINNWQNDSLYVNNEELFYEEYSSIFDRGVYNNLKTGVVDIFGINYYNTQLVDAILEHLEKEKPTEWDVLTSWLKKAKYFNGFYILGL